jgi:hypothetical protein
MALKKGRLALTFPTALALHYNSAFKQMKARSLSRNLDDALDKGSHSLYVDAQFNHSAFSFLGFLSQSKSKREYAFFLPQNRIYTRNTTLLMQESYF